VTLIIQTPKHLNEEAKELLRQFDAQTDHSLSGQEKPAKKKKGFFKKGDE
jgi:molecular chaperone DnaJ